MPGLPADKTATMTAWRQVCGLPATARTLRAGRRSLPLRTRYVAWSSVMPVSRACACGGAGTHGRRALATPFRDRFVLEWASWLPCFSLELAGYSASCSRQNGSVRRTHARTGRGFHGVTGECHRRPLLMRMLIDAETRTNGRGKPHVFRARSVAWLVVLVTSGTQAEPEGGVQDLCGLP